MRNYRTFKRNELNFYMQKDPSLHSKWEVRFMPGYRAIKSWYFNHWLWKNGHYTLARVLSLRTQRKTGIDIHPGATIGKNFFIDHGVGVVIGETCIIGDNVMVYQGVTLGATGKISGKRHPNVEDNVLIGAGAKVIGNITLGKGCKVGAGAIVIRDVQPGTTVVCPPAYPVHHKKERISHLCAKGRPRWITVEHKETGEEIPVFIKCPAYKTESASLKEKPQG